MSKEQLGEAFIKLSNDEALTQSFTAADTLEAKVDFLKAQGFDVEASDFVSFAQYVLEEKAAKLESTAELSDEELVAAQGGFFADIAVAGVGAAIGGFFGGAPGAGLGAALGYGVGTVVDAAIGAVVKSPMYDKLNEITSLQAVLKASDEYNKLPNPPTV